MRTLTDREKKTIRIGAIAVAAYLLIFGGVQTWRFLDQKRSDYRNLVRESVRLRQQMLVYDDKAVAAQKLMETFKLDPGSLSRTTAVAQASAAIQKTAAGSGIQVGPVREAAGRPASKELATLQLEGVGPVPAVTSLLSRLETVGFPVIVDTVQFTPDPARPGQMKVSLTIIILDFDQWEVPHA